MKLKNTDALNALKAQSLKLIETRRVADTLTTKNAQGLVRHVMVCGGPGCHSSGSPGIAEQLEEELNRLGLSEQVKVFQPGCFGFCEKGPMIEIHPDNVTYCEVSVEDVATIVEEHFIQGNQVEHLLYTDPNTKERFATNIPFYDGQLRIALRNVGYIAPENILEYIAADGYQALAKVLFRMTPLEVIDVLKVSGLRGRGGVGFSTGLQPFAGCKSPLRKHENMVYLGKGFWAVIFALTLSLNTEQGPQAAPFKIMGGILSNVSTLLTHVGLPHSPF